MIFDRYFPQVHSYVARRLGTDIADDLASETFLIAFRQRDRFDSRSGVVRAWLYGIATNLIRRHRRDEVRAWRATAKLPLPTPAAGHEERVAAAGHGRGASRELAAALAKVSAKDREVLMLVALGELTYEEVAAALGIKYGTVCSRLSRARRVVRETPRSHGSDRGVRGLIPWTSSRRSARHSPSSPALFGGDRPGSPAGPGSGSRGGDCSPPRSLVRRGQVRASRHRLDRDSRLSRSCGVGRADRPRPWVRS